MRKHAVWATLAPCLLIGAGMWARASHVDEVFGGISECEGCYFWLVVKHDLVFLGVAAAFMAAALCLKRPVARLVAALAGSACAAVYLLDVFVLREFGTRLRFADVLRFGNEFDAIGAYVVESLPTAMGVLGAAASLILVLAVAIPALAPRVLARRSAGIAGAIAVLATVVSFAPDRSTYVHAWAYRNLVEIARAQGMDRPYSEAFKARVLATHTPERESARDQDGLGLRPNIIVVLFESLSAYHSERYSGLNDWTPRFDEIGARHQEWPEMIANGFATEHGILAVIGGHDPIPSVDYYHHLDETWGFPDFSDSLPNRFKRHGYHTAFLTAGNLDFINKGRWLAHAGFDETEGHEHSAYEGEPRYHFKAAPDEALYRRALQWIDEQGEDEPWLLVLQTVSSHQPFIEPYTGKRSQELAVRYADEALGRFYDVLRDRNFLDDHVLVVASDHRAMTPVTADEYRRFGPTARSVIPFVVAGGPEVDPEIRSQTAQQTDIGPSLEWLVSDRVRFDRRESNLFKAGPAEQSRCVLHYRGDVRDRIDAFCGSQYGVIELNGDDTGLISGKIPGSDELIGEINRERIGRGPDY